jgi:alpha-galactosidase
MSVLRVAAVAALVIISSCLFSVVSATDNGLALTPQMGWNSWNHFQCSINEDVIYGMAQAMINTGLHGHGYEFVNIDDCWADYRDKFNRTIPDAKLFPSGMFKLGEKIHALGLKFGIYSDAGSKTCVGKPGGLGYEVIDALTYAAWGVDYLKVHRALSLPLPPRSPPLSTPSPFPTVLCCARCSYHLST